LIRPPDPNLLADALCCFEGRHDFHAFCAYRGNETPDTDYRRTVTRAACAPLPGGFRLEFAADGFLYKMVRMLAGAAVRVAQGRMGNDDLRTLLDQPPGLPRGKCHHCAPACGLYLREVRYGNGPPPAKPLAG
jgi:tRNA pseudouridine38-40 synthase